jgi:hypothetical protein
MSRREKERRGVVVGGVVVALLLIVGGVLSLRGGGSSDSAGGVVEGVTTLPGSPTDVSSSTAPTAEVPAMSSTVPIAVSSTSTVAAATQPVQRTNASAAEVATYALPLLTDGFTRFAKSGDFMDFKEAKTGIESRFPGVTFLLKDTKFHLTGAVEVCFAKDWSTKRVYEAPC